MIKNWTRLNGRGIWQSTSISMEESKTISTKNWFWINIDRDGLVGGSTIPYISTKRREEILDWCHDNCKKHWSEVRTLSYIFEDEEDLVLFALTWA